MLGRKTTAQSCPKSGDMPRNMIVRMHRVLGPHPVLGRVWKTVLARMREGKNLLSRLASYNPKFWRETVKPKESIQFRELPSSKGSSSGSSLPEQRRILVIGGYHRLNLGDDVLMDVLVRELAPCRLTFAWIGERFGEAALKDFDHVIIGGGSHWPGQAFSDIAAMKQGPPFSIIGVSAREALDAEATEAILKKAEAVILRDEDSRDRLHRHERIRVAPDLSWLQPVAPGSGEAIGLNLRFWHDEARRCDPNVIGEILRGSGRKIVPLPCFHGHPDAAPAGSRTDQEMLREAGVEAPRVCRPEDVRRCRVVVSMRFHPNVFAAQAGVPFVAFDDHPKTRAFARMHGREGQIVPVRKPEIFAEVFQNTLAQAESMAAEALLHREASVRQAREVYGEVLESIRSGVL